MTYVLALMKIRRIFNVTMELGCSYLRHEIIRTDLRIIVSVLNLLFYQSQWLKSPKVFQYNLTTRVGLIQIYFITVSNH